MNVLKLTKCELAILALTIVSTFVFNMLYDWLGQNAFIGLIAPINESVWEHGKLIFFPFLIYSFIETLFLKPNNKCNFFAIKFLSALLGVFVMTTFFYLYSGILGKNFLILDVLTGFLGVFSAFYFSYKSLKNNKKIKHCKLVNALGILVILLYFLFTFYPPHISLFISEG